MATDWNAVANKNIAKARELKDEGNAAYKAGDWQTALRCYHEIYMYIGGIERTGSREMGGGGGGSEHSLTEEQKRLRDELLLSHHLNLSAVLIKLERWEKAEANCTKALAASPGNPKALFRRGQCRVRLSDVDGAKADLNLCDQSLPDVQREQRNLKAVMKVQEQKQRKQFGGMFDRAEKE